LAIRDNSIDIVELLLAFGADPVIKDGGGNTGIHIAAATRTTECLKLLSENVRNKDDLNEDNEFGKQTIIAILCIEIKVVNINIKCYYPVMSGFESAFNYFLITFF